jgi:putative ABC transport system ATP-binding protein
MNTNPVQFDPSRVSISCRGIVKEFGEGQAKVTVLHGVDIDFPKGATSFLVGPSGCGKTTLISVIAGLLTATGGRVSILGEELTTMRGAKLVEFRAKHLGFIFQQFNLIPSLDVAANLAFQARLAGVHDTEWCRVLAERLGLSKLLSRYPEQLSGGQQQRVAIGRALAGRPKLILADEPTGNLDEATGDAVLDLMLSLQAETGAGLLLVTHSLRLAERLHRRLHLAGGRLA